jgi:hypothetical protein
MSAMFNLILFFIIIIVFGIGIFAVLLALKGRNVLTYPRRSKATNKNQVGS